MSDPYGVPPDDPRWGTAPKATEEEIERQVAEFKAKLAEEGPQKTRLERFGLQFGTATAIGAVAALFSLVIYACFCGAVWLTRWAF